jgi:glycosyltransferase involved in cell wall biosynthesis
MRIGIDARFAVRQPRRGIGTYSLNLLNEIVALDDQVEFFLYTDRADVEGVIPSGVNITVRRLWPSLYPLWEQLVFPLVAKYDKLDLLHTLGNTAPLYLPKRIVLVLTLHDVMFLQSGAFIPRPKSVFQRLGRLYRALVAPINARRSNTIITVSEFSRQDILNLIAGLRPQKVVVTHISCDPRFTQIDGNKTNIESRPFLLCLGAEDPRKNTLRIVQCYLNVLQQYDIEQDLIVSGYAQWENSPAHHLVKAANAEARVKFLPFISIEELISLYQHATALLYISLYEGFGIPIVEAFKCGCPVIASNSTSIPEVGGDAVIYVDPTNVSDIEIAIVRICNDPLLQPDLRRMGFERASLFGWDKVARETIGQYYRLLPHCSRDIS